MASHDGAARVFRRSHLTGRGKCVNAFRNAAVADAIYLRPMSVGHVDAVMAIERASHVRPWTRGNFTDSLANDYVAFVLLDARDAVIGYCLAAPGVDEMHLLNLSVAPGFRRRGHARRMLDALVERCRIDHLAQLWLEVRVSNEAARQLYRAFGLREVGLRPAYYPASAASARGRGEDAVLMRLEVPGVS